MAVSSALAPAQKRERGLIGWQWQRVGMCWMALLVLLDDCPPNSARDDEVNHGEKAIKLKSEVNFRVAFMTWYSNLFLTPTI